MYRGRWRKEGESESIGSVGEKKQEKGGGGGRGKRTIVCGVKERVGE